MRSNPAANLSPPELKLIESLRKQERRWPRLRWVALCLGVLAAFIAGLFGYFIWTAFSDVGGMKAAVVLTSFSYISSGLTLMALRNLTALSSRCSIHRTRALVLKLADA